MYSLYNLFPIDEMYSRVRGNDIEIYIGYLKKNLIKVSVLFDKMLFIKIKH